MPASAATSPDEGPASAKTDAAPFPFCSRKCKLVDLSRWFDGDYVISQPITNDPEALTALAETDPEALQALVDAESARALALLGNGESK